MLQRSLLDEVGGFDEDLPACEINDLCLRGLLPISGGLSMKS